MSKELVQKVFLMPDGLIKKNLLIIRLKHPRTGSGVLCAVDPSNQLYEIVHYGEDVSSWFIEESVSDDGSLFILTICDPLFFILPYADQVQGKFCPIEDLLMDENYADAQYLSKCCSSEELGNIFDSKESSGYKVFSYSKRKTLHWLQQKTKHLAKKLSSQDIDLSDGSRAASLKSTDFSKCEEKCLQYSCHLVSEYLSDEICNELFSSLGLKRTADKENTNVTEQKSKKQNISVKPEDDYSKQLNTNGLQEKQKKKLTSAQKQLMKVDKTGMKSISSFFQKK